MGVWCSFLVRSTATLILAIGLFGYLSTSANAGFVVIDDFQTLDSPNDFAATSIGLSGITVEVADNNGATVANSAENRYDFFAPNVGNVFVVRYDWAGVFSDLPGSTTELFVRDIPLGQFDGNWRMTIDNGSGFSETFSGTLPTSLPSAIEMDNSSFLQFRWDFFGNGGSGGFGSFGGRQFNAVPEPSCVVVLSVLGLVASRRRNRAN